MDEALSRLIHTNLNRLHKSLTLPSPGTRGFLPFNIRAEKNRLLKLVREEDSSPVHSEISVQAERIIQPPKAGVWLSESKIYKMEEEKKAVSRTLSGL